MANRHLGSSHWFTEFMPYCQIKASPLFSTSDFSSCPLRSHFQNICLEMCVISLIQQSSGAFAHLWLFGKHPQFDSHVLPSNKHEISSPWHQLTNSASRSPREVPCLPLRVQSSPHMFLGFFDPKSICGNFSFNRVNRKTHLYRWSIPAIIKREEINHYVLLPPAQRNYLKLPMTTQLFRHLATCLQKIPCFPHSCTAIKNWHAFLFMQFNAHTLFITLGIAGH